VRRLGILSDTHDNVATATAGVAALRNAGAEFLIHCGDVGTERILDLLAGIPSVFVFGNCDFDRPTLKRYALDLGIQCAGEVAHLKFSGKTITATHGDNSRILRETIEQDSAPDYIFVGHTHVASDQRLGHCRLINPGALHRATKKTVALLDLQNDALRFLTINV
jgi:putative phosphoesterase